MNPSNFTCQMDEDDYIHVFATSMGLIKVVTNVRSNPYSIFLSKSQSKQLRKKLKELEKTPVSHTDTTDLHVVPMSNGHAEIVVATSEELLSIELDPEEVEAMIDTLRKVPK